MKNAFSLQKRMIQIFYMTVALLFSYQIHFIVSPFVNSETLKKRRSQLHRRKARQLRDTALQMKGILIKIGQFMSTRVDLLPQEYIEELALLQDQVPPQPFSTIKKRMTQELGEGHLSNFSNFNEDPIAAASLGQVHEARLKDHRRVAVKVQYPGIQDIVKTDLRALRGVTRLLQWRFHKVRFNHLYEEFSRLLQEELNYIKEGRNAELFAKNFSSDGRIIVPKVVWEMTTPHVLTLEFVEGIKINRIEELKSHGIHPKSIAQLLVETYMKQILQHRFFHGDPHPGNIFVQEGPSLIFVDFGLMQHITPAIDKGIRQTVMAIIQRDIEGIVQGLMDLGFIVRTDNPTDLEQVAGYFMDKYRDMSPKEFKEITIAHVVEDISKLLRIYPFIQIPNAFILFARTAGMLNGLNMSLDPDLNIVELAKPYAQEFLKEDRDWIENLFLQGKEWGTRIYQLPRQLEDVLKMARRGEFKTRMSSEDVTGILKKIYRLGLKFTLGVLGTFFVVIPSLVPLSFPGETGKIIGALGLIVLIIVSLSIFKDLLKKT